MRTSPHQWCRLWRCLCAGVMVLLPTVSWLAHSSCSNSDISILWPRWQ
uniref:Uncharacterized protein n=1 Tax=Brassica oleracea TaxID=3712 RepID=A0A3P6FAG0_BRAOL|nr:unnamed protein product [Brassica oleracea]